MADKNICNVELLNKMSENTNVIVDENGVLNKLNLYNEISAINDKISNITNNRITVGDTLPLESQFYWDKDEEIPAGYVEVTPPFSNPNLLINSDFRNPVNQRGKTTYSMEYGSSPFYTIDRWKLDYGEGTLTVNNGYITLKSTLSNKVLTLTQVFEKMFPANRYTVSINVKYLSGSAYVLCRGKEFTQGVGQLNLTQGLNVFTTDFDESNGITELEGSIGSIELSVDGGSEIEVEYIKVEAGSIATPFSPRLYGEELALCQRYYQNYSNPWARRISNNFAKFYFKSEMRTAPTLIGTFKYYSLAGTDWGEITSGNIYTYTDRIDMWASGSSDWYAAAQDVSFDAEIY